MASHLLPCPTEILWLVLEHLSSKDLHAISLTTTRLRAVTEPFLYADVEFTWTKTRTPPIVEFLRSILERGELARFVQTLTLNGDDLEYFRRESLKLSASESDLYCLSEGIRKINVPYGELWEEKLRWGAMDAFVALLISQLPSLRSLHLDRNFTRTSLFVGMMFESALCKRPKGCCLPYFEHLLEVSLVYYEFGDSRFYAETETPNTGDILTYFYLPSVKRITAMIDNPDTFEWPSIPPNPLALESLDLTLIREGHLGQVLSVTTGLKSLRWEWYYAEHLDGQFVTDIIEVDQIAMDLSYVRENLTDLTMTARTIVTPGANELPSIGIKGSFRAFSDLPVLKRLYVPLLFLLGFSGRLANLKDLSKALPRSIEYLTITDDMCFQKDWDWKDVDLLEAVRFWLGDWKASTPRLRVFHLFLGILDDEGWGPAARQELRDLGAQAGIEIKITQPNSGEI